MPFMMLMTIGIETAAVALAVFLVFSIVRRRRLPAASVWGILGILAIVLPFGFMVVTLCLRIAGAHGRHVFLPLTALGIAGVVATIATSLVDCSFLRSDSMLLSGAFFALAASAFPAPRKQAEDEETMS